MAARILFLAPDMFGPPSGIGRYCKLVAQALQSAGNRLAIVTLADPFDAATAAAAQLAGIAYTPCNGSRPRFAQMTVASARRLRPDIVLIGHANFAHLGQTTAALTGAKSAAFLYGIEVFQPLRRWRSWGLRRANILIAISRYTAARAQSVNRLNAAKMRILHNCLDPSLPIQAAAPPHAATTLLTVARMNRTEGYKGHDYVIRALPELRRRFPHLNYDVIGDGSGKEDLQRLATAQGVADIVRFHGRVSDEELRQLYSSATVFIMPSRAEGFGFVFLEAMAHGLPVIGGNQDATPEVILDGETGYLVNPTAVDEIVARVSTLLADSELRARMGERGVQHVRDRFGFARFQAELVDYIGELA